jgi:RNA methyltransferase, TrmH family
MNDMRSANPVYFQKLSNNQAKFIKSLRSTKFRRQESVFVVEGAKNVCALLASQYTVQMIVGTSDFLDHHSTLWQHGTAALAVAHIPPHTLSPPPSDTWGLVLDNIRDPGNLGAIVRIADWYNIPALICSPSTVDLYNPKVLHASMGSFTQVQVYYTPLHTFLESTSWPILGTFTTGDNIHRTPIPYPGLIIIGNESQGINPAVVSHIQRRISIPRYGQAESLNAAMAAAIVCDNWQRQQQ